MADKGIVCPNRQWETWTEDDERALRALKPDVLEVLAYGLDAPWEAQTEQHLRLADELGARLQVRPYAPNIPQLRADWWADTCAKVAGRYRRPIEMIPANEMNLPTEGGSEDHRAIGSWLRTFAETYRVFRPQDVLHLPALSPTPPASTAWLLWRKLRLYDLFDVMDVHEYPGSFNSWKLAYQISGLPVAITEYNQTDPDAYLKTLGWQVRDASWFILSGAEDQRPYWLTDQPHHRESLRGYHNPHRWTLPDRLLPGTKAATLFGLVFVTDRRGTLAGSEAFGWRDINTIERVVIHHSATLGDCSADDIADYHVRHNGWPGAGYHFLIHPSGQIEYIGDVGQVRYHAGHANATSIAVCLAGTFTRHTPTPAAIRRTNQLIRRGIDVCLGRRLPVVGHRELTDTGYGPTECPGDTWGQWRADVIA